MENNTLEKEQASGQTEPTSEDTENTFIWYQDDSSKLLPIDYAESEFAKEMHCGTRKVRSHILLHSPMAGLLESLIMAKEGAKYIPTPKRPKTQVAKELHGAESDNHTHVGGHKSKTKLPLPIETIPFLKQYLKLESSKYKNVFELKKGKQEMSRQITNFMVDFCRELCKDILPAHEAEEGSDAVVAETEFIRHILFRNKIFGKIVLDELWEDQLQQRVNKLKARSQHLPNDQRASLLKHLFVTLDRYTSSLPMVDYDKETTYSENDLKAMFKSLLVGRIKSNAGKEGLAAFKIENSKFNTNTTAETSMKAAFFDLSRCGKRRSKDDYNIVRVQFLKDLGASVKPSEFETEFLNLHAYLTAFPKTVDDVKVNFDRSLKEWCRDRIDYCRAEDFSSLQNPPVPNSHIDAFISAYALDRINWFYPSIELTRTLFLIKSTHEYDKAVLKGLLRANRDEIKNIPLSANSPAELLVGAQISTSITSILDAAIEQIDTGNYSVSLQSKKYQTHEYAKAFFPYFQAACHFLFHGTSFFGAEGITDMAQFTKTFSDRACEAAVFFDKSNAFTWNPDKVYEMIEVCEKMLTSEKSCASDHAFSLDQFLSFAPDLLLGVLLQIFHKIARDHSEQTMLNLLADLKQQ